MAPTKLSTVQQEAIEHAARLFAHAKGQTANRNEPDSTGLDVFTPFSSLKSISLLGNAERTMKEGLHTTHAISVKAEGDAGNVVRLSCDTFEQTENAPGSWWSVALCEYDTKQQALSAIQRILKEDPNAPVISFADVVAFINNDEDTILSEEEHENAKATLDAFFKIENVNVRGLKSRVENYPPRFDPNKINNLVIIYDPSGAIGSANSLWTNFRTKRGPSGTMVVEEVA
jgi:hypothetical protein